MLFGVGLYRVHAERCAPGDDGTETEDVKMKRLLTILLLLVCAVGIPRITLADWNGDLSEAYPSYGAIDEYIWGIRVDYNGDDNEIATKAKVHLRMRATAAGACSVVVALGRSQADSVLSKWTIALACSDTICFNFTGADTIIQWVEGEFTSTPSLDNDSFYFVGCYTSATSANIAVDVIYGAKIGAFTKYLAAQWATRCTNKALTNLSNYSMGAAFWSEPPINTSHMRRRKLLLGGQ